MNHRDHFLSILIGGVSAIALATGAAAQEIDFDIKPGALNAALADYINQSGEQLIYRTDDVENLKTNGVNGSYEPNAALDELLKSTGFKVDRDPAGGGAIVIAKADDTFRDRSLIRVAQVLDGRSEDPGEAEDAETTSEVDTVIVTGTNIRGVENPTVPVLQFDREDIDLSGAATLDDFLRTIPQNFASETQLSANSGNPNDSGRNRSLGTSVDLRGLGAGSTLTLLNGRRMTTTGEGTSVDINVLPLGVIERVDVLTDGATAVYGSDAVGGVVNFVTRKDYEGLDINARYGTVTDGSKEDFGVGGAGGFSWGSGGVFAGVDYQEAKPLFASERDFVDLTLTPEDTTLGGDFDRFSVAGGVNQEFGSAVRFGVDVLYTDLNSGQASVLGQGFTFLNTSSQNALFINSRFEYDVTDKITAGFFFDYGRNRLDNVDSFIFTGFEFADANELNNDLYVYEGRLSGQLFDLPGGAISFSFGGLYREEGYENFSVSADTLLIEADRNVAAGYAELLVPIFGQDNSLPFIQQFELSIAGRYEDYSDFGDTFDPKIGAYWEVNDEFSLRASYSEAFRAPDLTVLNQEQRFSVSLTPVSFITAVTPPPIFTNDPVPSVVSLRLLGGNPDLTPERAKTWSAGFSYEPSFFQGLALTGNYFNINYTDRLESVNGFDPVQDPAFRQLVDIPPNLAEVEAIFARGAAGEITFANPINASPEDVQLLFAPTRVNIAKRDVSGFDLTVAYSSDTSFGQVSAGANASYLIDYVGQLTDLAPSSEQVNVLYRPVDFKLRGNLSWSNNGFTVFAALNYVDGYRDNIDSSIANSIDAWTTIDLSLAYDTGERFGNLFVDGTRIGFSVTNLFDDNPPFVLTPFGLNYDSANANPFGRQINFTISKTF